MTAPFCYVTFIPWTSLVLFFPNTVTHWELPLTVEYTSPTEGWNRHRARHSRTGKIPVLLRVCRDHIDRRDACSTLSAQHTSACTCEKEYLIRQHHATVKQKISTDEIS